MINLQVILDACSSYVMINLQVILDACSRYVADKYASNIGRM